MNIPSARDFGDYTYMWGASVCSSIRGRSRYGPIQPRPPLLTAKLANSALFRAISAIWPPLFTNLDTRPPLFTNPASAPEYQQSYLTNYTLTTSSNWWFSQILHTVDGLPGYSLLAKILQSILPLQNIQGYIVLSSSSNFVGFIGIFIFFCEDFVNYSMIYLCHIFDLVDLLFRVPSSDENLHRSPLSRRTNKDIPFSTNKSTALCMYLMLS